MYQEEKRKDRELDAITRRLRKHSTQKQINENNEFKGLVGLPPWCALTEGITQSLMRARGECAAIVPGRLAAKVLLGFVPQR